MLQIVLCTTLLGMASVASTTDQKRDVLPPPDRPILPTNNGYYNATGIFNPYKEKCCLGKILPHKSYKEKCCGSELYDPTKEMCCDGVKFPFNLGDSCCGKVSFNSDTQMCCQNVVNDLKPKVISPYLQCCGTKSYDQRDEICCYENNFSNMIILPSNGSNISPNQYGYVSATCCNGKLVNTTIQGCCNNQLYTKSDKGCCNDTLYDLDKQTCCYNEIPYKVVSITKRGQQCCGKSKKLYDPKTQVCCGDNALDKSTGNEACCGNDLYDYRNQLCCRSGNISKVIKTEDRYQYACCDGKSINIRNQSCCYGGASGTEKSYNPDKETCCGGKVYSDVGICCSGPSFTYIFHKIANITQTNYQCCGDRPFDYMKQICCGTKITDRKTSSQVCCGQEPYNYQNQLCCNDYDYSTRTTKYKVFEQKPGMSCCGLNLISFGKGEQCCNNKIYDSKNQVCCGSNTFPKDKNDDTTCCFQYTTDTPTQCPLYPYPIA